MWTYHQASGILENNGITVGKGYSGHGDHVNCPESQDLLCLGPIPRGKYMISDSFDHPDKGPLCMRLKPDPANNMHGRSGFLIHGDSIRHPGTASEGCIILSRNIRLLISMSRDHDLEVVL